MKKKVLLIAGWALALTAVLAACAPARDLAENGSDAARPNLLIAEGRLLPIKSLDLSFSVAGQVEKIWVADGEQVRSGQVLVSLQESPQVQADLARAQQDALLADQSLQDYLASAEVNLAQGRLQVINAQARYNTAKDNYTSSKSAEHLARMDEAAALLQATQDDLQHLEENNGLLLDTLQALQATKDTADTALASAQSNVDALKMRASMLGKVVDTRVLPGQKISAGELILSLADFSQWTVRTDSLTETEVVRISVNQKVEVVLDALPDVRLKGHVTNINERYEEKRGDITYSVTILVDESHPLMRWGMTAAVFFLEQ